MRLRNIQESDYPLVISVINDWWGGRPMADMLPKLFFTHFQDTSFIIEQEEKLIAVNKTSIAFHQRMGFEIEKGTCEVDGIPVVQNYDGNGNDRILFAKRLP